MERDTGSLPLHELSLERGSVSEILCLEQQEWEQHCVTPALGCVPPFSLLCCDFSIAITRHLYSILLLLEPKCIILWINDPSGSTPALREGRSSFGALSSATACCPIPQGSLSSLLPACPPGCVTMAGAGSRVCQPGQHLERAKGP